MAVYLRIKDVDFWGNEINSANLQIGVNQGINGESIGWFELVGDNGGSDGGTWEWERDSRGWVIMKMKSNRFGVYVAELHANEWRTGSIPPPKPAIKWFSTGSFRYTFPGIGAQINSYWRVVNIVGEDF